MKINGDNVLQCHTTTTKMIATEQSGRVSEGGREAGWLPRFYVGVKPATKTA